MWRVLHTTKYLGLCGLLCFCLNGCMNCSSAVSESPSVLPSPTPLPTQTLQPTRTVAPTLTPSAIPSPQPSRTAAPPPYNGEPFSTVFLRDGNLWLAETGGDGEGQLTTEPAEWPIHWFDVSPDCERIAYIPYQGPPTLDALVKQVHIPTGSSSVLTGEGDPYSEYDVKWLDDTHIAFRLQEQLVAGHDKTAWEDLEPFHHIILNLTTGERTFVPESLDLSQSPDGRYWLTCSREYVYEGACQYRLHDLLTNEQWSIAEGVGWGEFLAWSPDSQLLLFNAYEDPSDSTVQLVVVDVVTREERTVTQDDRMVAAASWSPDGQTIAFAQCSIEACTLQLVNRDGSGSRMIPTETAIAAASIAWTPSGARLVFTRQDEPGIWSIKIDGTDLRVVVSEGVQPQVLCTASEQ